MTRARAAAALAAALLIGLALLLAGERQAPPLAPAAPASAPAASTAPAGGAGWDAEPLPESLRGTSVDGDLRLDADGRFVPGPEAVRLFEYFLSATGEEPAEKIRLRILAAIRQRLPPAAARDAEALLERFLAYREAAAELFAARDLWLADEERRFQLIRELRREVFGAGLAGALFGEEERIVAVDVERRRVTKQPDLDPAERARRLAALEQQLPEAVRAARREALAAVELRAAEAELRAAGAGPAEIEAERERRFGHEAAARLAALDRRRAEWEERVAAYRTERDALRAQGLAERDYQAALAALRDAHFAGPERTRIDALDRMEAEARPAGNDREAL